MSVPTLAIGLGAIAVVFTLAAQLIHIGSMYTPGLSAVLQVQPVSFVHWSQLLLLALLLLVVMAEV